MFLQVLWTLSHKHSPRRRMHNFLLPYVPQLTAVLNSWIDMGVGLGVGGVVFNCWIGMDVGLGVGGEMVKSTDPMSLANPLALGALNA